MELRAYQIIAAVFALAMFIMIWQFNSQKNKTIAVQERLNSICGVTRGGLEITSWNIRKNDPDKAAAIRRIYGDGDVTGTVLLESCVPKFDREAWFTCVNKNDEACMVTMLNTAAKSLQR